MIRIKENSIGCRSRQLEPTDMEGLQKLITDKKNMQKLHGTDFCIFLPNEDKIETTNGRMK